MCQHRVYLECRFGSLRRSGVRHGEGPPVRTEEQRDLIGGDQKIEVLKRGMSPKVAELEGGAACPALLHLGLEK